MVAHDPGRAPLDFVTVRGGGVSDCDMCWLKLHDLVNNVTDGVVFSLCDH